jgi:hypothetical protein
MNPPVLKEGRSVDPRYVVPDSLEGLIQFMSMNQVMFSPIIEHGSLESVLGDSGFFCQSRGEGMISVDGDVEDPIDGTVDVEETVLGGDEGVVDCAIDLVGEGVYEA